MNPFRWLRWLNERVRQAPRPRRRKPVLRVIEGGLKQGIVLPRANATLATVGGTSTRPTRARALQGCPVRAIGDVDVIDARPAK
jgi:hypothetical protein